MEGGARDGCSEARQEDAVSDAAIIAGNPRACPRTNRLRYETLSDSCARLSFSSVSSSWLEALVLALHDLGPAPW